MLSVFAPMLNVPKENVLEVLVVLLLTSIVVFPPTLTLLPTDIVWTLPEPFARNWRVPPLRFN